MQLRILSFLIGALMSAIPHAACVGVGCLCVVAATPVAFAPYTPVLGLPQNASGNVAVTCTAVLPGLNVSYVIDLNTGLNGAFAARKMNFLSALLEYNLYTDSAYTVIWGNGTSGTSTVADSYNLNVLLVLRNYTVYGKVPSSQNVTPGIYNDTITVTVTY